MLVNPFTSRAVFPKGTHCVHVLETKTSRFDDGVFFSGYFHCRQCGAGGPWDLATSTKWELLALTMELLAKPADARITIAKVVLFDGTSCQTAALAEEHLKRLVDENPTDYFLWSRLGNLLRHAEQKQKAVEAYEKAIELNPQDVESHYNLGELYLEDAERERAAEHFHAVLRFARDSRIATAANCSAA